MNPRSMFADTLVILQKQRGNGAPMFWPELLDALRDLGHQVDGNKVLALEYFESARLWVNVSAEFCACLNALRETGLTVLWMSPNPQRDASLHRVPLAMRLATRAADFGTTVRESWCVSGIKLADWARTKA